MTGLVNCKPMTVITLPEKKLLKNKEYLKRIDFSVNITAVTLQTLRASLVMLLIYQEIHLYLCSPPFRSLTHSELAPLRASLVPMEHCITRFFQECDGDQDKLITLKEWCRCFGIKEGKPWGPGKCTVQSIPTAEFQITRKILGGQNSKRCKVLNWFVQTL